MSLFESLKALQREDSNASGIEMLFPTDDNAGSIHFKDHHFSVEQKMAICGLHRGHNGELKLSIRQLGRQFNLPHTTIQSWLERYEHGTELHARAGRPLGVTDGKKRKRKEANKGKDDFESTKLLAAISK